MRSTLVTLLGLATTALAQGAPSYQCMTDSDAQRVAQNFGELIQNYSNQLADRVLAQQFTDYSDSVNTLINNGCPNGPQPLGSATFTSLEDFKAGQGSQPSIPFQLLNVWHNCDTVTLRWRSSNPGTVEPEEQVTGIIVLETCHHGGEEPWIIDTVYSEFNSGAWLYDLGVFVPTCNATSAKFRRDVKWNVPRML